MQAPIWIKPAVWGGVVGVLGTMMLGFSLGGWVLDSTVERTAKERERAAVTAVLVPICVEKFMAQTDAAVKLTEFKKQSYQQRDILERGGWATIPGGTTPNSDVAKACAMRLAAIKT